MGWSSNVAHARIQFNSVGGRGFLTTFLFSHQRISQRYGPPSRGNWTLGPNASRGGAVPVFLKKPIVTCDFPGVGVRILSPLPPLDPPMRRALVMFSCVSWLRTKWQAAIENDLALCINNRPSQSTRDGLLYIYFYCIYRGGGGGGGHML